MIHGLDSAYPPSLAQVQQAKAAGFGLWAGYIATKPNVGLLNVWTQAQFDIARQCGSKPIAYCSGWDDPVALKALASQWDVLLALDVESGIRGDGSWVQGFLDASGASLYGNGGVHAGRRAPFHILAGYPGNDPQESWVTPQDCQVMHISDISGVPGPHGWQYQGTTSMFGIGVDLSWFDDSFGGSSVDDLDVKRALMRLAARATGADEATGDQWNSAGNFATCDTLVQQVLDASPNPFKASGNVGPQGPAGKDGVGIPGPQGVAGLNGKDGKDGASVKMGALSSFFFKLGL